MSYSISIIITIILIIVLLIAMYFWAQTVYYMNAKTEEECASKQNFDEGKCSLWMNKLCRKGTCKTNKSSSIKSRILRKNKSLAKRRKNYDSNCLCVAETASPIVSWMLIIFGGILVLALIYFIVQAIRHRKNKSHSDSTSL